MERNSLLYFENFGIEFSDAQEVAKPFVELPKIFELSPLKNHHKLIPHYYIF